MGQLLNRLRNFAKVHLRRPEPSLHQFDEFDEDAELKRIIDELNSEEQRNRQGKNTSKPTMNYKYACEILKVRIDASVDEIKNAYKQRIKEYHPDLVENFGEELRQLAKQKSQQINEAYQLIKKVKGF